MVVESVAHLFEGVVQGFANYGFQRRMFPHLAQLVVAVVHAELRKLLAASAGVFGEQLFRLFAKQSAECTAQRCPERSGDRGSDSRPH
jgi:hypothetical protein